MSTPAFPGSERSRVRRHPERGSHDRALVHAILDEALVCHLGLVVENRPLVIPMAYGRDGDRLFLHGASASRLLRALAGGVEACVTVTLLDGLVLARSTFSSSLNYRSVVAFGRATRVEGEEARRRALDVIVEHLIPGRTAEARPPNAAELAATEVVEFAIEEATAKVRTGPPKEPEEDVALPVWAGVIPSALTFGTPEPAPNARGGIEASVVVSGYRRPARGRP